MTVVIDIKWVQVSDGRVEFTVQCPVSNFLSIKSLVFSVLLVFYLIFGFRRFLLGVTRINRLKSVCKCRVVVLDLLENFYPNRSWQQCCGFY